MVSHDIGLGRTVFELCKSTEYAATAVVDEQNAEIAAQRAMPQCIGIVEEAEVADDACYRDWRHERIACSDRQGAFDAVATTVDEKVAVGKEQGCTYCHAVGYMYVHRSALDGMEEASDS